MRKIFTCEFITLDGVIQSGGAKLEDDVPEFDHVAWFAAKRIKAIVGLVISVAVCFLLTVDVTAQSGSKSISSSDRKAIEFLFAAWNSRNAEKVVLAFSKEALYEDVAAGQVHRGSDEIRKWAAGAFRDIENFKLEVVRSSYYHGGGSVEWVWSGTDKGLFKTGKSFSVRGVSVIEVRGGKIVAYREYYDFSTVMRQLGLNGD